MNKKFYRFALGIAAISLMASCSNEVKEPTLPGGEEGGITEALTMEIAKTPDFVIWSGNGTFVGNKTRAEEGNATNKYDQKEVEINLAINDIHEKYDVLDLVSHLSIHVRTATEVTVTLPVEEKYYCDQDDVYIYNERSEGFLDLEEVEFKGEVVTQSYGFKYTVAKEDENGDTITDDEGNAVVEEQEEELTVTVSFIPAERKDDGTINSSQKGSIEVKVTGITQEIIDYCRETYGDGINFDVYNYYIRGNQQTTGSFAEWTLKGLSEALNGSKVTFGEVDNVEYYINAFTREENGVRSMVTYDGVSVLRDCKVEPTQLDEYFWFPTNGSKDPDARNYFNMVYLNQNSFPNASNDGTYDNGSVTEDDTNNGGSTETGGSQGGSDGE